MATSIRLKRVGAKKQASYRIVVIDSREGTSGASVERLGIYNPRTQPSVIQVNAARALHWLNAGAAPSDTVRSLFKKAGVWKQFHDGVTADALDEEIVLVGPAPGARGTSQRPMPTDRSKAPAEAPAKKEKAGKAAAQEAPSEEAAAEDVVVEPEPIREEEPEVADVKAEAEGGEPVAEAVEAVEEEKAADADEAPEAEPVAEAAEEVTEAAEEEAEAEPVAEQVTEVAEEETDAAEKETEEEPVAEAVEADEEAGEASEEEDEEDEEKD